MGRRGRDEGEREERERGERREGEGRDGRCTGKERALINPTDAHDVTPITHHKLLQDGRESTVEGVRYGCQRLPGELLMKSVNEAKT